jgi:hypothetical protein
MKENRAPKKKDKTKTSKRSPHPLPRVSYKSSNNWKREETKETKPAPMTA